ncbi:hypothetical protein N7481_002669 [Penicillium waksmanii]|uniref:uncharacterized protein n=1 Tax=Penicillium waksmanii TaxID=69791 RepID=UPI0025471DAC|nr:uncharacterized protein N7481_002669 [Penicillium waksmanii]KAJ5995692.1 hypothetical protein N7481_002669 [Penicillium waksmanii]
MLVTKIIAIAAIAVANVSAIANIDQTVSDIHEITHKLRVTKRSIDSFNGGVPSALRIANAVFQTHSAAEAARDHLGASDPFSGPDSEQTMDAYNDMRPVLMAALQAGQDKAPQLKKSGFGYIARGMMHSLYLEKGQFEQAVRGQLSRNHTQMLEPSINDVDAEFKRTLEAFEN